MSNQVETQVIRLDNGLRVAVRPGGSTPQVGVAITYDVGSRNERPGASGFAHLFEHMMFQGSANVGKAEHFRLVSEWGGQANGTTSQDRTNYYQALPSHQLALGLWLEADRMRSLAVNAENFENQRQTVMEERRERIDNSPYGAASVRLSEMSFSSFAYAHPVIGYWDDLERAELDQVQDFHRTWYRPDQAVIGIAGDVDPTEAVDLAQSYFGDISSGERPAPPDVVEAERTGRKTELLADPLARLPAIFLNHQAGGYGSVDFPTWEVVETLLLMGPSSRLYRRLVVDEAVAVQIGGGYECYRGPGLFGLQAITRDIESLERVRECYLDEIQQLACAPVTLRELHKVHNQIRSAVIFGQQRPLSRAISLSRNVLFHDDPAFLDRYLERVIAVEPEQIQSLAQRWLDSGGEVDLRVIPR
jgi:predicted Zn-dependent peptidase